MLERYQRTAPHSIDGRTPAMPERNELHWHLTDRPDRAEAAFIDAKLNDANHRAVNLSEVRPLTCFVRRSENGPIVGGAVARTWGECCELQQLWVDEAMRRHGIGTELVRSVENEARSRGCTLLYLDTFTWQAPAFYGSLGYEVACRFDGFPNGATKFIMRKALP